MPANVSQKITNTGDSDLIFPCICTPRFEPSCYLDLETCGVGIDAMAERPFLEQILLDEIQGKNNAMHAFDRIIWTIRTGFVTVFFGAWGILVTGLARENADLQLIAKLVVPLWIVSAGLSLCAWLVDVNYMRRKFRVIRALNTAFDEFVDHAISASDPEKENASDAEKDNSKLPREKLKAFFRVSGDSGGGSFAGAGYDDAKTACTLIYTVPCITVAISLLAFSLIISYAAAS